MRLRRSRLGWQGLGLAAAARNAELPAHAETPPAPNLEPVPADVPDLLHPEPRLGLDAAALRPLLEFAFAGGDVSEALGRVLGSTAVARSDWDPDCFAKHLFVDELIETACPVRIDGRPVEIDSAKLARHLLHPPADGAVRAHRQAVLRELAGSAQARAELIELYREVRKLRARLMNAGSGGRYESTRRRLEILSALRAVLERLGGAFDGSLSGLAQLHSFGSARLGSEAFARLVDLLEHERNQASVSLDAQLGADGRVRSLIVRRIAERTASRFYRSPLVRFGSRLRLWLRGFRVADEELIDRWLDTVFEDFLPALPGLLQLAGHAELYLAALGFKAVCEERGLAVCLPEIDAGVAGVFEKHPRSIGDDSSGEVRGLFNPLLLAQGVTPVPGDFVHGGPGSTTIVTGPNSGGKTRLLQALGLTQLLAQAGFFVPASSARLRSVPGLFCSLVQEEAFDQSEGRLGSELLRIRRLFEQAPPGALVILDELCSGTNPSEGEEIFMLVLSLLGELGPETVVTTHFLSFASRLEARAGELRLRFLQVDLDDRDHPTYAFVPGVATTSLAALAASRLGVTREEILALVRRRRERS